MPWLFAVHLRFISVNLPFTFGFFLTMRFFRRWLFYLSPLLCIALLAVALWFSRQSEPTSWRSEPPAAPQLHLMCDDLLQDPVYALLEAFQRRCAVQIEVTALSPDKVLLDLLEDHPDVDLLLTIENLAPLANTFTNPPSSSTIAQVQPVVLASSKVAEKIKDWGDLRGLRLALPDNQLHALGARASNLLTAHQFPWADANAAAVFHSADGDSLARAVALGRADAAILWMPNALQFATVATPIKLPVTEQHWAKVALVTLGDPKTQPELTELIQFLQGAWAREVFEMHGYIVP